VKSNDLVSSIVMLVVGLGFIGGGLKCGIGPLNSPDAGFFPTMMGGIMCLLSMALFVKTLLQHDQSGQKERFWLRTGSWKKILISLLSLVFYMLTLDHLGYIVTTFLFILSLFKWVSAKKWATSVLAAIILSLGSYLLFKTGLGVSLPMGFIKI
jgi:putative tricarboxylic transport membrane protein